ncbi:MAG: hypothetical protein WC928_03245 [Patescibacteria group bacterium]|jgi:hypothetical protein
MSDLQDKVKQEKDKLDLLAKKRKNDLNRFLNSYFKFFSLFFILLFLWASFRFIVQPKFKKVVSESNNILIEKKSQFIKEYRNLQNYKKTIAEFSEINPENIYKILKILPDEYTRDDLFTEITYFFIKNNFKLKSVDISPTAGTLGESLEGTGRRSAEVVVESPQYLDHLSSLPTEVGSWFIEVEFSGINYFNLKYLLSLLENNLKIVDTFSVEFSPQDGTAKIGLLTYYYKK